MEISHSAIDSSLAVLDVCCGMGGLTYGFTQMGFAVTGIDVNEYAGLTFSYNKLGEFQRKDLLKSRVRGNYGILMGGPPCEPWSSLNLTKRKEKHPKYQCLTAFFNQIAKIDPKMFIMENVPAIGKDPVLLRKLEEMQKRYAIAKRIVRYSDYGAAFSRKRLFIIGIKKEIRVSPEKIFEKLKNEKPKTVRNVIGDLRNASRDPRIEHVWPNVKTIRRYLQYYKTGKYGWYILKWDKPSPSFGNVTKTYILHPDSFKNGKEARPISVREALRIVGFSDKYVFPNILNMRTKYEMIADAVSPVFSLKLAKVIQGIVLPALQDNSCSIH